MARLPGDMGPYGRPVKSNLRNENPDLTRTIDQVRNLAKFDDYRFRRFSEADGYVLLYPMNKPVSWTLKVPVDVYQGWENKSEIITGKQILEYTDKK